MVLVLTFLLSLVSVMSSPASDLSMSDLTEPINEIPIEYIDIYRLLENTQVLENPTINNQTIPIDIYRLLEDTQVLENPTINNQTIPTISPAISPKGKKQKKQKTSKAPKPAKTKSKKTSKAPKM